MRDKITYKRWMWPLCFVMCLGGAWLQDHTGSNWWVLLALFGCAGCFVVRKLEDRFEVKEEAAEQASLYWRES